MAAGIKIADAYFVLGMVWEKQGKQALIPAKQLDYLESMSATLVQTGAALTATSAAVMTALAAATHAAGKHQSEVTRMSMIYGELTSSQKKWMDGYMEVTKRGTAATTRMMTTFGAFSKGLGFTDKTAAGLSKQLTTLTGDFQTFTGISTEEAMQRMISALSGSGEVLDRFGINIKEAALNQKMLAMGMPTISQGATEQMKTLARLALITEALKNQGAEAYDQYADTYPKALAITRMALEDVTVEIGNALLPAVREMMKIFYNVIRVLRSFIKENQWAVQVVAVLAAGLGVLGGSMLAVGGAVWGVVAAYQTYLKLAYLVHKINKLTWSSQLFTAGPIVAGLMAVAAAMALVAMGADNTGKSIRKNLGTMKLAWEAQNTEILLDALYDVAGAFAYKLLSVLIRVATIWIGYINLGLAQIIPWLISKGLKMFGMGLALIVKEAAYQWNLLMPSFMKLDTSGLEDWLLDFSSIPDDLQDAFFSGSRELLDKIADGADEIASSIAATAKDDADRRRRLLEEDEKAAKILADQKKANEDAQNEAMENAGLNQDKVTGATPTPLSAATFRSVQGQQAAQQNMMTNIVDLLSRIAENTDKGAQNGEKATIEIRNLQLEAV